jgi:hypothetical protein
MTQAWPGPVDPADPVHLGGWSFGQLAGPVHLPSLTRAERDAVMADLRDWVISLISRHHIDVRVIPPCWERHSGMVEALSALRDLERDCYSEKAPPGAAVDWFRGYREIAARLTEVAAITNCTSREHRDPPPGWPDLQHDSRPSAQTAAGAPPRT